MSVDSIKVNLNGGGDSITYLKRAEFVWANIPMANTSLYLLDANGRHKRGRKNHSFSCTLYNSSVIENGRGGTSRGRINPPWIRVYSGQFEFDIKSLACIPPAGDLGSRVKIISLIF